jgi:chromosome segregation ATPase
MDAPDETKEFLNGSIKRVYMKDFMSYNDASFNPGPRVNIILGPNGSGKSTIVCALALTLGGDPKVLGRAAHPGR